MLAQKCQQLSDEQQQIPGTSSIISQGKRANNQSLVQDVWEYDHDPNDSFLMTVMNQKFRKYHSSQQCLPKYIHDNICDTRQEQNQYHSMVHESGSQQGRSNQYGLIGVNYADKHYGQKKMDSIDNESSSYINQLQRAINTVQNKFNNQNKKHLFQNFKFNDHQKTKPDLSNNPNANFVGEQINTQIIAPPFAPNPQLFRDQDILCHKQISNYTLIRRQIKQMMQLIKIAWMQLEIEETRGKLIKMDIENKKLKISLRSSSMGSKFIQSKVIPAQVTTAVQQYGYADGNRIKTNSKPPNFSNKFSSHRRLKGISSSKSISRSNNSNLIRVQSSIRNQTPHQQEFSLQERIIKQKTNLQILKLREQQLDKKLIQNNSYFSRKNIQFVSIGQKSAILGKQNTNINIKSQKGSDYLKSNQNIRSVEQFDTQQTNRATQKDYSHKKQLRNPRMNAKQAGYRQLLIQKRNVIKQTLEKSKQHYQYKLNKLHQENGIVREQVKIVDEKIYQIGMRARNKNSISSQKNIEAYPQRPLMGAKRLLTSIQRHQQQPQNKKHSPQNTNKSKSKRKILVRSPMFRGNTMHPSAQNLNKQLFSIQMKQLNLRRACSQEHILSNNIHHENQELLNILSIDNYCENQVVKRNNDYLLNARNHQQRKSQKERQNEGDIKSKTNKI